MQFKQFQWKTFWYSFALTFLFAIGGGIVTYAGMPQYEAAVHPALTPPSWLFPVVWSILFLLMTYSAAVIYDSGHPDLSKAIFVYALQLTMNFWWCVLFFGFKLYLFAFIWLILLWIAVLVMIILFYRINKMAGLLQIPYLVWLTFAAYLNLGLYLLNR